MPAMRIQPSLRAARSKREEQSRLIGGGFYHANLATQRELVRQKQPYIHVKGLEQWSAANSILRCGPARDHALDSHAPVFHNILRKPFRAVNYS
jgi:hypothetical protein